MTSAEQLAAFVIKSSYEDLSETAKLHLKGSILDSLGCAIGAIEAEPIQQVRDQVDEFGGNEICTLMGGGRTAPDRAAFHNSALVRYLDFNDSYLAKGETCHPSDNLGAVLAACEYANLGGRELMTALAVSYQVQCRLSDVAPVRAKGFDHVVQGCYALAAGISKALGLNQAQTANAIAICGTAFNALRVTRTGTISQWKGLAYPNAAFCCMHGAFLAKHGITGPPEVFEGNKGFIDSIAGKFDLDWSKENLEKVTETIIKKYNAEIHSQSALEGLLELKKEQGINPKDIQQIKVEIFDVAYNIIGGGEEGDKAIVENKVQADHSLPYMLAVALLDNQVMPEQYVPERILRQDVQQLLRKIHIQPSQELSLRFPAQMPCRITIKLNDGRRLVKEKRDYEGFTTRPMTWETLVAKFERLSEPYATATLRKGIIQAIEKLEEMRINELMSLLTEVQY